MSYIFTSLKDTSFIHHFVEYLGSYQISEHWRDNISVFSKDLTVLNLTELCRFTYHLYHDTAEHPVVNKVKIQNSRPISK